MPALALPLALGALMLLTQCQACVYLMGEALDSVAAQPAGTHWNYGFKGDDWEGVDANNTAWGCKSGTKQSPINLHPDHAYKSPRKLRTSWSIKPTKSNGTNIQVFNNGHTIQVQWAAGVVESDIEIKTAGNHVTDVLSMTGAEKVKKVKATPLQFHFHSDSEHAVDGHYYPLELHVVKVVTADQLKNCPAVPGCLSVTSVMLKLDELDNDNPYLEPIFNAMSEQEGVVTTLPAGEVLDIEAMLPDSRNYVQYEGSLTTPPCTEGLLWHVFTTAQTLSLRQLRMYQRAVGLKECTSKTSRRLLEGGHDHAHTGFVRGSYSGFTRMDALAAQQPQRAARALLAGGGDPNAYTCEVKSYGFTNRNVQPLNERLVRSF